MHVPNGWEIKHLSEVANINPKKSSCPKDGLVSFVPMNAVSETARLERTETKIYDDVEKGFTAFKDGDVLVAKITPCFENGKGALVFGLRNGIGFGSTEFHVLRAKQNNSAEFIYYVTTTDEFRVRGEKNMQGSAGQKRVPTDYLKIYKLAIPPCPEQQKIAQILSTWDKAIEKLEALIAAKQKRKKALMQQLLTGKKRFAGFEREWQELNLEHIFKRVTRKNREGNTNVVTISAQKGLIKQEEFFNKTIASETLDNYFLLKKSEFAYNKSYSNGYPMGAVKRLNNFDKAVVTTLYICFAIKDNTQSCSNFFEHYFESGRLIPGLMKVANEGGRAHGLLNVTPKDFFNLKIRIPEFAEQKKIASVLTAADTEIDTHQKQLAALKKQKKGLMQQLLTGKKRVQIEMEV